MPEQEPIQDEVDRIQDQPSLSDAEQIKDKREDDVEQLQEIEDRERAFFKDLNNKYPEVMMGQFDRNKEVINSITDYLIEYPKDSEQVVWELIERVEHDGNSPADETMINGISLAQEAGAIMAELAMRLREKN